MTIPSPHHPTSQPDVTAIKTSMHIQPRQELWILCPHCDLMNSLPSIELGMRANCPRCATTLSTNWDEPRKRPTGYALAALFMLVLALLFPFINMNVAGLKSDITLLHIPEVMISVGYNSLAILLTLIVIAIPAACMVIILLLINMPYLRMSVRIWLTRALFKLKKWGMAEIFLAGVLVSFVKLMAYGSIGTGISFIPWCLFCIFQLRAMQCIDRRWLWQQIAPAPQVSTSLRTGMSGVRLGMRSCSCCTAILAVDQRICPRCHTRGYPRRKNSLQWTMALLFTSLLLYIPANLMPIMITEALGSKITSTIMAGVIVLWSDGSWPIALIIFIASIMVPSLKMLAIAWLCWSASRKKDVSRDSEKMHKIYEVVEFVGRWSMIDVFVIAVLSALVRMGVVMNIYPAPGALLFAAVVVLTMLSAMCFDPRLSWDCASENVAEEAYRGKM